MKRILSARGVRLACALLLGIAAPLAHAAPPPPNTLNNYTLPADQPIKVLLMRPDVSVGSLGVGGIATPSAEWTEQARSNLIAALKQDQINRGYQFAQMPELEGEKAQLVADYQSLFRAVALAVISHKIGGLSLPTKKARPEWSMGPEARQLAELGGGNYALFLYTDDSFGTAGRKAAQIFAAALLGAYVPAGVHVGYAGLVDLKSGKLLWFNQLLMAGGDPREADGAARRVSLMLANFPKRASTSSPSVGK